MPDAFSMPIPITSYPEPRTRNSQHVLRTPQPVPRATRNASPSPYNAIDLNFSITNSMSVGIGDSNLISLPEWG